jgi:hypothetical protein
MLKDSRLVYICHAREDEQLAEEVRDCLASKDYLDRCFFPTPVFTRFSSEDRVLNRRRIDECNCAILIYTDNTNKHSRILQEMAYLHQQGKPIYPLWMSDAPFPPVFEKLVDTDDYKVLATCFTKKEKISQLMTNRLFHRLFCK